MSQSNLGELKEFIDLKLLKRDENQTLVLTWRGYYYAIREKIRQIIFVDNSNLGNKLILNGKARRVFKYKSYLSFKTRLLQTFYLNYFQLGKIKRTWMYINGLSDLSKRNNLFRG